MYIAHRTGARQFPARRRRGTPEGRAMSVSSRPSGVVDLLVVAAYAPELTGLRRLLGDELYGNVSGVHVAGKSVGIGLANASAGATQRVLQLTPRAVVLVGTCGA